MLMTAGRILATKYHVEYPILIQTITPPGIAANAVALFFASAIAAVWGKRLPIVIGVFVIWINMLVGYYANSLNYYRNLGIVNGIFGAGPELLIAPIITDLVYVHQRGRFLGLSTIVGLVGMDAGHIISGNIIKHLGVKYLYIVSFGVMVPIVIAVFVFVRETTFHRKPVVIPVVGLTTPTEAKNMDDFVTESTKKDTIIVTEDLGKLTPATTSNSSINGNNSAYEKKLTWIQHLKLYRGRLTDRSFFKALVQPFPLMVFPSVLFSTIVNGAMLTWAVISGIINHQVMLYPPYNLQPDVLAYISLPGSAVGLISSLAAGFLSDWLIKFMSKRNRGVYEPEFRLILMIPAAIFSTIGFMILGPLYQRHAPVAQIVITGLLFHVAGPFASSACVTYIFDTMQNTSTEAFVATSLFKHIFIFLATTYVPSWFAKTGPVKTYQTLAILNLAFAAVGIPMYIFGKRARGMVARNAFLMKVARTEM